MSTALGPPIDLSSILDRSILRNRVSLVGVELEGGWINPTFVQQIIHDGSVIGLPREARVIGELPSPPMTTTKLDKWVVTHYPKYVNESCGMHVHMSFETPWVYQRLVDPRYPSTIIKYVGEWAKKENLIKDHPIWTRLAGKSVYCQHIFDPSEQSKAVKKGFDRGRPGHRYTVVNYCYSRTNTIEVRLLPMMETAEQAVRAINHVIQVTNAFLVATARREAKKLAVISVETDTINESREFVIR